MLPIELTLIVAATRNMGIGRGGTLPWSGLKKEMAYFARVTKRIPSNPSSPESSNSQSPINAVIMGRKTWESIPERFRPLKGRLNIVLSRSYPSGMWDGEGGDGEPVRCSSLASVLGGLSKGGSRVARVFVIGGADIYAAAIEHESAKRILLTRIQTDFDCDTFFPITLAEGGGGEWKRKAKEDLDAWVGEEVPGGVHENGIDYVFEMYERD